jgi:UDP-N-acetylglucosamine transferase subunit ALG13
MIFVTVGTQLPFPRLINALDNLAGLLEENIIAQTGSYSGATRNVEKFNTLDPAKFEQYFIAARVIVAHAGIGSILSAKRYGKPLVLFPRRVALGEHRNDHQLGTARQMETVAGVYVSWKIDDLGPLLMRQNLEPVDGGGSPALEGLTRRLKDFIEK